MTTSAVKVEEYFFGKFSKHKLSVSLRYKIVTCLYFTATTLDKAGATSTWQPLEWEPAQRLAIRQLMLGHTAKEDEFNVVEVSYMNWVEKHRISDE